MFLVNGTVNTYLCQYGNDVWVTAPELVLGDEVIFRNATGATYTMKPHVYQVDPDAILTEHNGKVVVDVPDQLLTVATPVLVEIKGYPESKCSLPVVPFEHGKPEDYVLIDNTKQKNHPDCIVVEPVKTVTVHCAPNEEAVGGICVGLVENANLVAGEKHAVIVDGVVYECVPISDNEAYTMGNFGAFGDGEDTGEPFVVIDDDGIFVVSLNGEKDITIRIPEKVEPIDQKYLPMDEIILKNPAGVLYTLTVDENGELTVNPVE